MTRKLSVVFFLAIISCISVTLTAFADSSSISDSVISAAPLRSDTNISFSSPGEAAVYSISASGVSDTEPASGVVVSASRAHSGSGTAANPSGPGVLSAPTKPILFESADERGESLGVFSTTGYCNCSKCNSGGHKLTYSGTVPQANHTVSADLDLFPIGTRLMIGDTIYTVEDKGHHIDGNWIDIYYDNHEDAWNHGRKAEEVFAVKTFSSVQN